MKIGKHYLVAYQHKADWVNFVETKLSTAKRYTFNIQRKLLEVTTNEGCLEFYLGLNISDKHSEHRLRGYLFHSLILLEGAYDERTMELLKSRIRMFVN